MMIHTDLIMARLMGYLWLLYTASADWLVTYTELVNTGAGYPRVWCVGLCLNYRNRAPMFERRSPLVRSGVQLKST